MKNIHSEQTKAQQAQELQSKIDQLQQEAGKLMLELTTLYGKYASVLQENVSLKAQVVRLEPNANLKVVVSN